MGDCGTSTVLTRYESMRLRSFRQRKRTTARDPVQHKRWIIRDIGRSIQNINKDGRTDGVRRLLNIWKMVINKGMTILKGYKCCTPLNKAMSEISNCFRHILCNPCILLYSIMLVFRWDKTGMRSGYTLENVLGINGLEQGPPCHVKKIG